MYLESKRERDEVCTGVRGLGKSFFLTFTRSSQRIFLFVDGSPDDERHGKMLLTALPCLQR